MEHSSAPSLFQPLSNGLPQYNLPAPAPTPKPRNKLGPNGVAVLEAYWSRNQNPLQLPPLSDRKELTWTIKGLPGCGFWNDVKTADWFKRRMKKLQTAPAKPSQPSEQSMQHLEVLLKSQPNPSPDVVRTWATLLARDGGPAAVEFWIGYITHAVHTPGSSSQSRRQSVNLPTPARTVTPEPHSLMPQSRRASINSSLSTKMKHDPADSPIISSLTIRTQYPDNSSSHPSLIASSSSSSTAGMASPVSPFLRVRQMPPPSWRSIIEDVFSPDLIETTGAQIPNNADEFVTMFAPYEDKLNKLQQILESEK